MTIHFHEYTNHRLQLIQHWYLDRRSSLQHWQTPMWFLGLDNYICSYSGSKKQKGHKQDRQNQLILLEGN